MEIIKSPNKILSTKSADIEQIDQSVRDLASAMYEMLSGVDGVGLAAPQIGQNIRLAVIGFEPTPAQLKKNPDLQNVPKIVLINPKITWQSKETTIEKEGCLSCGNTEIEVPRYKKVHIEHLDLDGKKCKIKARGYLARVMQHEIDHLEGKLITDYKK